MLTIREVPFVPATLLPYSHRRAGWIVPHYIISTSTTIPPTHSYLFAASSLRRCCVTRGVCEIFGGEVCGRPAWASTSTPNG